MGEEEQQQYRVSLDVFGGPLDLLLYLVQKSEVDIFNINIADILDQYMKYVEALKEIDIEVAGEFLAMAARLLEIKSRMLLPRPEVSSEDEEIIDPRAELMKELLEYRQFKEKALALEEKMKLQEKRFAPPGLSFGGGTGEQEPEIESLSVWDMMLAFHKVTKDLGLQLPQRKIFTTKPASEYIPELLAKVQSSSGGTCTFGSVFEGAADIATLIGTFLAMLECVKLGYLKVYQEREFGEIYLLFIPENERTVTKSPKIETTEQETELLSQPTTESQDSQPSEMDSGSSASEETTEEGLGQ